MKILFLTSRFPYPLEKGDKLRAFELIKHLSAFHEIILFAINDDDATNAQLEKLKPYCTKISVHKIARLESYVTMAANAFRKIPFSVSYFFDPEAKSKINNIIETNKPDFIFCHLIRMSEYVRHIKHIPKMLDYMDAFSAGMMRLKNSAGIGMKQFAANEYSRLKKYEHDVFSDFEFKTIISEQDRDLIDHPQNKNIAVIPNGVDFDFFIPQQKEKKFDLLFAGNMNYPPNIESVLFIAEKILPLLKNDFPHLKFVVSGANPSAEIKKLATTNIIVTGWVDDIRNYFYESKILLAPMLISIGLQNKILQAMAMKTPCIISTLANNAIGAMPGRDVLIADSPDEYANAISDLLKNNHQQNLLAENAYTFVKLKFDWKNVAKKINAIIEK